VSGARRRLVVVGGAGLMGRLLARVFRKDGFDVRVADPAGTPRGYRASALHEVSDADVVIVSAPLSNIGAVLGQVLDHDPRGLVFDIASVKAPVAPALDRAQQRGLAVASVHPMFGPGVASLEGRDLIVCDAGQPAAARRARRLFHGHGLKIRTMPLAEHDPWIAKTMGLAHFASLAVASTLARSGISSRDLDGAASTSFRRLLDLVHPILDQAPALTRAIQAENPEAAGVAAMLAREVARWMDLVKSPEAFARELAATRRLLG